jgi:hypothetical protein
MAPGGFSMKMRWLIALAGLCWIAVAGAQEPSPILGDRPDPTGDVSMSDETFVSEAAGISLRVPGEMELVQRGSADEIAQFIHAERKWILQVSRRTLTEPKPLSSGKDANGKEIEGFLETTISQFLIDYPQAQIIREDALTLGEHDAAILAARVTLGTQRHLMQQGIIQANPQLYYLLTLSTPTEVPVETDDATVDPRERQAVQAFMKSLESVKLSDLSAIREDQDKRLLATRAFLETLTSERLKEVLIDEQWLRIIKGSKDIGYTYVVEESDKVGSKDAIVLLFRSRTIPSPESQIDASLRIELSCDRRHESWSGVDVVVEADQRNYASEFGSSDLSVRRVIDRSQFGSTGADPKQPPIRELETYKLKVTHTTKTATAPPVERDLPPFYLPHGIYHLLPRLLPTDKPGAYLFASYVGSMQQVMLRYVDVGTLEEVTLDGNLVSAIPIRDRIGLEGPVTIHYVSPDGKFLGTVSSESKTLVLPTDEETLLGMWKDADLSRPDPNPMPKSSE